MTILGYDNCDDYYKAVMKHGWPEALQGYGEFYIIRGDLVDKESLDGLFAKFELRIVLNLAA